MKHIFYKEDTRYVIDGETATGKIFIDEIEIAKNKNHRRCLFNFIVGWLLWVSSIIPLLLPGVDLTPSLYVYCGLVFVVAMLAIWSSTTESSKKDIQHIELLFTQSMQGMQQKRRQKNVRKNIAQSD